MEESPPGDEVKTIFFATGGEILCTDFPSPPHGDSSIEWHPAPVDSFGEEVLFPPELHWREIEERLRMRLGGAEHERAEAVCGAQSFFKVLGFLIARV